MTVDQEPWVTFLLFGEELLVQEDAGGWRVRYRDVERADPHLDHALAAVLSRPHATGLAIALRILGGPPGSEVGE